MVAAAFGFVAAQNHAQANQMVRPCALFPHLPRNQAIWTMYASYVLPFTTTQIWSISARILFKCVRRTHSSNFMGASIQHVISAQLKKSKRGINNKPKRLRPLACGQSRRNQTENFLPSTLARNESCFHFALPFPFGKHWQNAPAENFAQHKLRLTQILLDWSQCVSYLWVNVTRLSAASLYARPLRYFLLLRQ